MSKKVNHRFEPELRFPEFKGTPQWKKLPIGKKVELLSGYPFKSQDMTDDPDGTPLLRGINITEGHIRHSKDIDRYIAGDVSAFKKYLLKKDDLVIGMDGSKVGKNSALVSTDDAGSLLIQRVARLRSGCNSTIQFIYQHVHSSIFHSYVDRINTSGGIPHISAKQINDFEICFPEDTREQQKIADCLSSLDELITVHTQKHEALQSYKKGLMQNLFPAEGETAPALRFPDFQKAWKTKGLGRISKILRGGSPRPIDEYITTESSGLNWLKIADVNKKSKYVVSTKEKVLVTALSKTREVNRGDLIMSNSMSFGRPYILKIKSCIHDGWIAITEINERIYRDYLYYLILSPTSQSYFLNNAAGSGVLNLNADIIKLLPIPFPDHAEQKKIAGLLSSIDDLIAVQEQKIEDLKSHKKGLMQQLFPAMDEGGA